MPEPEEEVVRTRMDKLHITQKVWNKISKLRKDAAPGPGGITPGLFQKLGESVITPLL